MASGMRVARGDLCQWGTARVTSPQPERAAEAATRYPAPTNMSEPDTTSTLPKVPLWPAAGRGGRARRTKSGVISRGAPGSSAPSGSPMPTGMSRPTISAAGNRSRPAFTHPRETV